MRVSIVGLGNLGSAIAYIIAGNGHTVTCWEYDEAVVVEVNNEHRNQRYLPDRVLPESIIATSDVAKVLIDTELVLITLPARFIASVLAEHVDLAGRDIPIVNMAKGIDAQTGETAFQLVSRLFPEQPVVMLAGPSLANELVRGVTTGLVAASPDSDAIARVALALNNQNFFVRGSIDPVGVELGGILKNIYALGLGMFVDPGLNFIGAYLTQALAEIKALGVALGARADSFDGLSGIGDLIATSLSEHSHNRSMGGLIAQGLSLAEVEEKMGILPEGYHTLGIILPMAERLGVAMPLANLLSAVITGEQSLEGFNKRFTTLMRD
jgi:glycerol-3-phosphate dehydrogenase (NAD(P)+)